MIGVVLLMVGLVCSGIAIWLLGVSFHSGLAALAAWTNAVIFATGAWLAMQSTPSATRTTFALLIAGFAFAIISGSERVSYERRFNIWWQPQPQIEHYLRTETPIGASEQEVLKWLHEHAPTQGNPGWWEVHRAPIPPHSDYPLTTTGGAAFMHVALHHEPARLIPFRFASVVEGFYTFDAAGRLSDIRVRVTVNGL